MRTVTQEAPAQYPERGQTWQSRATGVQFLITGVAQHPTNGQDHVIYIRADDHPGEERVMLTPVNDFIQFMDPVNEDVPVIVAGRHDQALDQLEAMIAEILKNCREIHRQDEAELGCARDEIYQLHTRIRKLETELEHARHDAAQLTLWPAGQGVPTPVPGQDRPGQPEQDLRGDAIAANRRYAARGQGLRPALDLDRAYTFRASFHGSEPSRVQAEPDRRVHHGAGAAGVNIRDLGD